MSGKPALFCIHLALLWGPFPGGEWLLTGGKGPAEVPGLTPAPCPADPSPRTCLPTQARLRLFSLRLARPWKVSDTRLPSQPAEPRRTWLCRRSGLWTMRKALPRSSRKWKGVITQWDASLHSPDTFLSGRKVHSWSRWGGHYRRALWSWKTGTRKKATKREFT